MDKKPFQIKLTEAERDRLDRHRRALGARSQADVVRYWIDGPLFFPTSEEMAQAKWESEH